MCVAVECALLILSVLCVSDFLWVCYSGAFTAMLSALGGWGRRSGVPAAHHITVWESKLWIFPAEANKPSPDSSRTGAEKSALELLVSILLGKSIWPKLNIVINITICFIKHSADKKLGSVEIFFVCFFLTNQSPHQASSLASSAELFLCSLWISAFPSCCPALLGTL